MIFVRYGYVALPLWVFAEQLGVPIPAAPILLAAGAIAGTGRMNLLLLTALARLPSTYRRSTLVSRRVRPRLAGTWTTVPTMPGTGFVRPSREESSGETWPAFAPGCQIRTRPECVGSACGRYDSRSLVAVCICRRPRDPHLGNDLRTPGICVRRPTGESGCVRVAHECTLVGCDDHCRTGFCPGPQVPAAARRFLRELRMARISPQDSSRNWIGMNQSP